MRSPRWSAMPTVTQARNKARLTASPARRHRIATGFRDQHTRHGSRLRGNAQLSPHGLAKLQNLVVDVRMAVPAALLEGLGRSEAPIYPGPGQLPVA